MACRQRHYDLAAGVMALLSTRPCTGGAVVAACAACALAGVAAAGRPAPALDGRRPAAPTRCATVVAGHGYEPRTRR